MTPTPGTGRKRYYAVLGEAGIAVYCSKAACRAVIGRRSQMHDDDGVRYVIQLQPGYESAEGAYPGGHWSLRPDARKSVERGRPLRYRRHPNRGGDVAELIAGDATAVCPNPSCGRTNVLDLARLGAESSTTYFSDGTPTNSPLKGARGVRWDARESRQSPT